MSFSGSAAKEEGKYMCIMDFMKIIRQGEEVRSERIYMIKYILFYMKVG